jgi:hypothetical protein
MSEQVCADPNCLHLEDLHIDYEFGQPRPCEVIGCKCDGFMGD